MSDHRRPRRLALSLVLAAGLLPAMAGAQVAFERCSDPNETPERAARFCADALEQARTPRQRALVALNLGIARLALDNPRGAREAFDLSLAADPTEARALAGRARSHIALGAVPRAAVDFNRAVDLAPRDADILSSRGAFRLRVGNADGALADFEAAARLEPRETAHTFNRGMALAALGRDPEAERAFSAVITADESDSDAWLNRARLRAATQPDAALADFNRAIALRPEWGLAWFERGLLHHARGRRDEADADFRRAWELGHRNEFLEERVRGLRG